MELEYRMYGLVPYNISPIQQGIQFGHAVVEYGVRMEAKFDNVDQHFVEAYNKWKYEDKTFIILNGGTTNDDREIGTGISKGTLNQHFDLLREKGVMLGWFTEPDLGNQLTAVVFLVDERVWDKKKYPDLNTENISSMEDLQDATDEWIMSVGGHQNAWLREFLSQFRLA
ncbi:MAG: hypothetical protein PQJ49_12125 [Sphaerochaetaceae bacterium]|nr:hypothetical protein [Sphaerochaetaceae bacterium]